VTTLVLPQLGETVTEGTITRWIKQPGDEVAIDEPIYEVSTDKVDTEVTSPCEGRLTHLLVAEGETVPIGTPVAEIAVDGEPAPPEAATPSAPVAAKTTGPGILVPTAPSARREKTGAPPGADRSWILSPSVRRLLTEHGLEPAGVEGTGQGGRITREDVERAASRPRPPVGSSGDASRRLTTRHEEARDGDEVVPFPTARRVAGEHLRRSVDTAVHTLVVTEVDYSSVERARQGTRLTYLPFVARATIDALRRWPRMNASVGDGALLVHPDLHLGIAVDLQHEGLVVPVVRHADRLRLEAIGDEIRRLSQAARNRRLGADDLAGGTFTITNAGAHGTFVTAPVINLPQIAILSTDGVAMAPVARQTDDGSWAVVVRPIGRLSLTFDHRAVDGAYAAAFLADIRQTLEQRAWEEERS
jgi:pyruvate dehydrogenase E2 component (dihydrolipoamide acetyltransferase)